MTNLHPIIIQIEPSDEQKKAIVASDVDVAVTAGAGTGKTRTLVGRFLRLLADPTVSTRQIVAITFTRKAAREMRLRIRQEIEKYVNTLHADSEEFRFWSQRLQDIDGARISTIHGLCGEVIRHHPAEAGIDPAFQALDDVEMQLVKVQIVRSVVGVCANEAQFDPLFEALNVQKVLGLAGTLLARRLDSAESISNLQTDLTAHWEASLAQDAEAALDRLVNSAEWQTLTHDLNSLTPSSSTDKLAIARQTALSNLPIVESTSVSLGARLQAAQTIKSAINLRSGSQRAWGGKEALADAKTVLRKIREQINGWLDNYPFRLNDVDNLLIELMPLIVTLFQHLDSQYKVFKRQNALLDFDDLEQVALELLTDHASIRDYWQNEVQALLIDEFQDTNARQRAIAQRLNAPDPCLFIVGDAKQSIYRFRGANVEVFREERQKIKQSGGKALELAESYRAHNQLLNCMNQLLQRVMGSFDDPQRPWQEPFQALSPKVFDCSKQLAAPHIEFQLVQAEYGKTAESRQQAGNALAERIIALDADTTNEVSFEDVTILCRAATSFAMYEDAFERYNIPYVTVSGQGFYQRPEIRSLLNLLHAIDNSHNDLAIAGMLKLPFIRLSNADLLTLHTLVGESDGCWWDVIKKSKHPFVAQFESWQMQYGHVTLAELLDIILDDTRYLALLTHDGQLRAVRNILLLRDTLHRNSMTRVHALQNMIADRASVSANDGEARTMARGAVQIMTVHQAKGLEFPVVVLGNISWENNQSEATLIDPRLGILLGLKIDKQQAAAYKNVAALEKDKAATESQRLLYVAATRAQNLLIASGTIGLKKNGDISLKGWLKLLATEMDEHVDAFLAPTPCDDNGLFADEHYSVAGLAVRSIVYPAGHQFEPRPIESVQTKVAIAPNRSLMTSLLPDEPPKAPNRVEYRPVQNHTKLPATTVGTIVHDALEQWILPDQAGFDSWFEAQRRNHRIDIQLQAMLRERVERLLRRFMAHAVYDEIVSAEIRIPELPYQYVDEYGQQDIGRIDLLYKSNGQWIILDYKTNYIHGGKTTTSVIVEHHYDQQLARYTTIVQEKMGVEVEARLCFLDDHNEVRLVSLHNITS